MQAAIDQEQDVRWQEVATDVLINHILKRFHETHRAQLPPLVAMARRVEETHGLHAQCPTGLAGFLQHVAGDLELHMQKEEQILFPMMLRGAAGMVAQPIMVMRHEHDMHGQTLLQLAQRTHNYAVPEDACDTWRNLYRDLKIFADDLATHIEMENTILFRRYEQAKS